MSARASLYRSLSQPRRGLRREEAAAYIGVSPSKFDALVAERRMPSCFHLDGCSLWDLVELDAAFEAEKNRARARNSWDRAA
jgi:predicted DNA-binding transcriptional regulator AlpA